MLFYSSDSERLCMIQFALLSLVPGLLQKLDDCADPAYEALASSISRPTTLKTSERASCESTRIFAAANGQCLPIWVYHYICGFWPFWDSSADNRFGKV